MEDHKTQKRHEYYISNKEKWKRYRLNKRTNAMKFVVKKLNRESSLTSIRPNTTEYDGIRPNTIEYDGRET